MTVLAFSQPLALRWNWPRVGALSGTLALHLFALALLFVPPLAIKLVAPVDLIPDVRLLDAPPPAPAEPPEPVPPRIVHALRHPPRLAPVMAAPAPAPAESSLPEFATDPPPPADAPAADIAPVDTAPTALAYLTRTRVAYPKDALKRREQGSVILRVLVGVDGLPQAIEIERSSGFRSLDLAALAAVAHWTFTPGTSGGIRSALWARVPIAFSLQSS